MVLDNDFRQLRTSRSEKNMGESNSWGHVPFPMAHPLDATQRLRADEVTETNQRDAYQSVAPATQDGLFLVPKVIE